VVVVGEAAVEEVDGSEFAAVSSGVVVEAACAVEEGDDSELAGESVSSPPVTRSATKAPSASTVAVPTAVITPINTLAMPPCSSNDVHNRDANDRGGSLSGAGCPASAE
jgi:hypothetical protein